MRELPVALVGLRGEQAGAGEVADLVQGACDEFLEFRVVAEVVDEGLGAAVDDAVADHVEGEDGAVLFGEVLVGGEHVGGVDVGEVAEEEVGWGLGNGEFGGHCGWMYGGWMVFGW